MDKEFKDLLTVNEALFDTILNELKFYHEQAGLLESILRHQQMTIEKLYDKVYELMEKEKQLKEVIIFE